MFWNVLLVGMIWVCSLAAAYPGPWAADSEFLDTGLNLYGDFGGPWSPDFLRGGPWSPDFLRGGRWWSPPLGRGPFGGDFGIYGDPWFYGGGYPSGGYPSGGYAYSGGYPRNTYSKENYFRETPYGDEVGTRKIESHPAAFAAAAPWFPSAGTRWPGYPPYRSAFAYDGWPSYRGSPWASRNYPSITGGDMSYYRR